MNQKISNKYYWIGILTIVPVIGLVIGILLFRKGVILKNRLLRVIGTFGILFTVAFYLGGLFYSKYSDFGKRKRVELEQMSLDRVMQDIEYYKVQFGNYPDSLQQLKVVDNMVFIMDELSQKGIFSTHLDYLQYKRIDSSNYTVFSAGIDRITNTSDDVYPPVYNWLRTGLVKPRLMNQPADNKTLPNRNY